MHRITWTGIVGALAAVALFVIGTGLTFASPGADLYRAHYPHGVHKLRTDKASEKITWDSTTLAGNDVKNEKRAFANLDEFQAEFAKRGLNKAAYIEIAGVWDHAEEPATNPQQNEALLKFLRANGYEEASFASLKKYYGATGHHFIDPIRADGKITWGSSRIKGDRVVRVQREFASVDEFKNAFREANVDKQAEIEVHARSVTFEGATKRAVEILEFLHGEEYTAAGPVSN